LLGVSSFSTRKLEIFANDIILSFVSKTIIATIIMEGQLTPTPDQKLSAIVCIQPTDSDEVFSFGSLNRERDPDNDETFRPYKNVWCHLFPVPDYVSYIELKVKLYWAEQTVKHRQTVTFRLYYENVTEISSGGFDHAKEAGKYPHITSEQWNGWTDPEHLALWDMGNEPPIQRVSAQFGTEKSWSGNLFHHTYQNHFGPHSEFVQKLATLLKKPGNLQFLVQYANLDSKMDEVRRGILRNQSIDPILSWYPNPRQPVIERNKGPKPEVLESPGLWLGLRRDSFINFYDYANIMLADATAKDALEARKSGNFSPSRDNLWDNLAMLGQF
jgi:hypothetical protein